MIIPSLLTLTETLKLLSAIFSDAVLLQLITSLKDKTKKVVEEHLAKPCFRSSFIYLSARWVGRNRVEVRMSLFLNLTSCIFW